MLLYEYKVRDEFTRVSELAGRIRAKFDLSVGTDELLQDTEILGAAYDHLLRLLPDGVAAGNFVRHRHFMKIYLKSGQPELCRSDIEDICEVDLPALEKAFRDWCASQQHYDASFAEKVGPLLFEQHLDSAVRKAFVILKERLCHSFGQSRDLDGRQLVNAVFGANGYLAGKIPKDELESLRNLLDGLYGAFRNEYQHQDVEPPWHEVEAVLSMINWVLQRIEELPSIAEIDAVE